MRKKSGERPSEAFNEQQITSLMMLRRACEYARDAREDVWQFAVEAEELLQHGVSRSEFRWLLACGYVSHAMETTEKRDKKRRFRNVERHVLDGDICFVLTEKGQELAARLPRSVSSRFRQTPHWHQERLTLSLHGRTIRKYRRAASNQHLVLATFQDLSWPERIDNPFGRDDCGSRRKLHDTIKCLNLGHRIRRIKFRGDGTGQGVLWRLV